MELVCHRYMCILLYVKLICCIGIPKFHAGLEEGGSQSAMGICCSFVDIYAHLEERV